MAAHRFERHQTVCVAVARARTPHRTAKHHPTFSHHRGPTRSGGPLVGAYDPPRAGWLPGHAGRGLLAPEQD
eukprot:13084595-Alexandrium_andersonii.AAC.1